MINSNSVKSAEPHQVGMIHKAVRILRYMADHGTYLSIRELSAVLNIPRSTLHRTCQLMAKEGLLELDPKTNLYNFGPVLISIAQIVYQADEIRRLALPVLREVVRKCNESAFLILCERDKRQIVFTERVQCDQAIRYHMPIGVPLPLAAGASGKSIMAFFPEDEIEAIINEGLQSLTERTIIDPDRLRRELAEIRAKGFAVSRGERTAGAVGISCPIFDATADVVGNLTVSIPEYRFKPQLEKNIVQWLSEGSERVSRLLGLPQKVGYPPTRGVKTSGGSKLQGRTKQACNEL
jgi:DNA-binding IclR family transcriptional regulator